MNHTCRIQTYMFLIDPRRAASNLMFKSSWLARILLVRERYCAERPLRRDAVTEPTSMGAKSAQLRSLWQPRGCLRGRVALSELRICAICSAQFSPMVATESQRRSGWHSPRWRAGCDARGGWSRRMHRLSPIEPRLTERDVLQVQARDGLACGACGAAPSAFLGRAPEHHPAVGRSPTHADADVGLQAVQPWAEHERHGCRELRADRPVRSPGSADYPRTPRRALADVRAPAVSSSIK